MALQRALQRLLTGGAAWVQRCEEVIPIEVLRLWPGRRVHHLAQDRLVLIAKGLLPMLGEVGLIIKLSLVVTDRSTLPGSKAPLRTRW